MNIALDLWLVAALGAGSAVARLLNAAWHHDRRRMAFLVRRPAELGAATEPRGSEAMERQRYYRRLDGWFAPLPFLWCWLEISLAIAIGRVVEHWAGWLLAAALVAGRMRALQEIGHNAVHGALCRSRSWQWLLSNVFFQFPLMKRDMASRFVTHVKEHHRTPNKPHRDPNLMRIIEGGVVPGISHGRFLLCLFYPLTPRGFWVNLRTSAVNSVKGNASWREVALRLVAATSLLALVWWIGGATGLALGFVLPLLTLYPWYSWVSLMVEHRWFCADDHAADRWQMECVNCRPTAFPGVSGWLLGALVFPYSDRFHLAHSLYPYVRWEYLPTIDDELRRNDRYYAVHQSEGLLWKRGKLPSALSELRDRVVGRGTTDLASWAMTFSRKPSGDARVGATHE